MERIVQSQQQSSVMKQKRSTKGLQSDTQQPGTMKLVASRNSLATHDTYLFCPPRRCRALPEAPGLALRLEKCEKVALADGALDVTDDGAVGVVEELDADLRDTAARSRATDDLRHLAELDWLILRGGDGMGWNRGESPEKLVRHGSGLHGAQE